MLCPNDQAELVMTERQGIEIDYCPKCRGVWLDRGELDKIIERAAGAPAATPAPAAADAAPPQYQGDRDRYRAAPPPSPAREPDPRDRYHPDPRDRRYGYEGGEGGEGRYGGRSRRRGVLGEIFDF
ncbi:MAG: zf-TFIIB domain-containing protein [Rhodospirillales bacterium]